MNNSFIHNLLGFRFVTVCGILIALIVWGMTTDMQPLSSFLFSFNLYALASLVAVAWHIFLWLVVYKGSTYEFWRELKTMIQDIIIINLVILSFLGCLFWLHSFVLDK